MKWLAFIITLIILGPIMILSGLKVVFTFIDFYLLPGWGEGGIIDTLLVGPDAPRGTVLTFLHYAAGMIPLLILSLSVGPALGQFRSQEMA
ncbi:MAG: hypothetical protein HPY90_07645 [Syntrophothermus sp.]|uniref:hypothetical protein n=1 Tax=Syntrophothermus sp. TaxID=2736299 RepID=UPI0025811EE3|nr:hypothetical protein [Syntrophothermus sp.]NSW83134.1 hypothetical protein [Syntrophothermus sp.]